MRFSKSFRYLVLTLISISVFSCKNYPNFIGTYNRIEVGPGPEDMALDTFGLEERIIISCSERREADYSKNGFYVYDLYSKDVSRLSIIGLPNSIGFRPHGIDVGVVDGHVFLYSVNHEKDAEAYPPKGRQSILVFELNGDSAHFHSQLTSEILISPNDVCVDYKGGIYVSNDSGERNNFFEKLFELKRSTIIHFNGESWKYVGEKIKYANGVGVRNNRLFVTGTQENNIYSYRVKEDGTLTEKLTIPSFKGNDNITFSESSIVTTAHLDFMKFIKHVKKEEKPSPCAVYSVDLQSLKIDTMFIDNGSVLSAASTGLIYNEKLYVSQVFNPFILEISLRD